MSTIYYDSKHHNVTVPTAVSLSIGTSGYLYGTSPVNIGGDDTIINHGVVKGGSGYNYNYSSSSIYASGKGAKIVNYGSIIGVADATITYNYITDTGIFAAIFLQSGTVINKGDINTGGVYDIFTHSEFYCDRYGIWATGATMVTNTSSIAGGRVGIQLTGTGTINNSGTIFGPNAGIVLSSTASLSAPPTLINSGLIFSHGTGVKVANGNGVTNSGTIKGGAIGFEFTHGGELINSSGGEIFSYGGPNDGVYSVGGFNTTIENYGNISSLVNVGDDATVSNSGTISGPSSAIHVNTSTTGAGATVINTGHVGQTAAGSGAILFNGNGVLNNSGEVDAPAYGVSVTIGTVSIGTSGEIEATSGSAITISAGQVSIFNTGGIDAPGATAVSISGGQVNIVNGGSASFSRITGKSGVIANAAAVVTITNYGTIEGDAGNAVELLNKSDRFIAHAGNDPIGAVKATGGVLEFAAGPATYMHDTLGGSYTGFGAYKIDSGGSWSMHGTNALASGLTLSNYGALNLYGTLTNSGDVLRYGVNVKTFGILNNAGYISSVGEAVSLGLYGTISNTGTLRGTGLTNAQGAVEVTHTSDITNNAGGIIEGYNGIRGVSVTLANSGLIHGYNSCGVYLTGGASEITISNITNNGAGTIEGGNFGVFANSTESIVNAGVISGGVDGVAGAVILTNTGTISGGQWGVSGHASVTNHGSILYGIGGSGGAAFIYNAGYIKGGNINPGQYAVELAAGGSLTQVAGGIILGAPGRSIGSSGGAAIHVAGGTLAASIDLAGGRVQGGAGIFGVSYAYTTNPPGVGGAGAAGIDFIDTGSLTIAAGVTFAGGAGGAGGTGKSSGGTGGSGGAGLNLDAGGSVYNAGVIVGGGGGAAGLNKSGSPGLSGAGGAGIFLGGGGVVNNSGDIQGGAAGSPGAGGTSGVGGAGISASAGGTVFNRGQISGYDGVRQTGGGALTIVNYGAISGSRDCVLFSSSGDRLVVESGSTFTGAAAGGGGTLELAGVPTGDTITGLGSVGQLTGESSLTFGGFDTYQVDSGVTLVETGSLGANQTLINHGVVLPSGTSSLTLASAGAILNFGNIIANPATNYRGGVEADSGGRIANYAGAFIGAQEGISGSGFTLVNYGEVDGTGNCSVFINGATASVTNTASGTLQGYNYGVASVQAATVVTAGSINGQIASVEFRDPSSLLVVQSGAVFTGGAIRGGGGTIVASGGSDTLTGLGGPVATLSGSASGVLGGFNSYAEAAGTLTLSGVETLIAGKTLTNSGVLLVTGNLTNLGAMHGGSGATGATYYGPAGPGGAGGASATVSGGTLVNRSSISGGAGGVGGLGYSVVKSFAVYGFPGGGGGAGGAGVTVQSGRLTNIASIVGGAGGAGGRGGAFPVGPAGSASGGAGGVGGAGVSLTGGTATNSGTIRGGGGGVGGYSIIPTYGGAGGTGGAGLLISGGGFTNSGAILAGAGAAGFGSGAAGASGDGVLAAGGGKVVNALGGTISGFNGVEDDGKGGLTVTNQGSISGTHDAVLFAASSDRLVVDSGAKFTGAAVGGGGTLEFNEGGGTLTLTGATGTMAGAVTLGFSGFGLCQLDAGLWTLNAPITVMAGQTLRLANAATALIQGALTNAGVIALNNAGTNTDLRVLAAGATLSGGGRITLNGSHSRIYGASAATALVNVDITIVGAGQLGFARLTLTNEAKGVIDATGSMTVNTKGSTLANAGLIEASVGGTLILTSTTIDQSGGGRISAAGGTVDLESLVVIGGTLTTTGAGLLRVNLGTSSLDGTKSAVSLTGELQVLSGKTLSVAGTLADSGKLNVYGGKLVVGAGGVTLSGGGEVNLNSNAVNAITASAAGAALTNAGDHINGAGTIGGGTLSLVNQAGGLIFNTLSVALIINTGANTIINAGTIDAAAGVGGVSIQSAMVNTGKLLAYDKSTLTLQGAVTGTGIAAINGGHLMVDQAFGENVEFTGTTGVLELENSQQYTGRVSGLSSAGTNSMDLADISFTKGTTTATYSGTTTLGTLTVTDGTHTAHIKLAGDYTTSGFKLSSDGHGGTTVVDPQIGVSAVLTQAIAGFQNGSGSGQTATPAAESAVYFTPGPPLLLAQR